MQTVNNSIGSLLQQMQSLLGASKAPSVGGMQELLTQSASSTGSSGSVATTSSASASSLTSNSPSNLFSSALLTGLIAAQSALPGPGSLAASAGIQLLSSLDGSSGASGSGESANVLAASQGTAASTTADQTDPNAASSGLTSLQAAAHHHHHFSAGASSSGQVSADADAAATTSVTA